MNYLETLLGAACMLLILADVFLTILYARAGSLRWSMYRFHIARIGGLRPNNDLNCRKSERDCL